MKKLENFLPRKPTGPDEPIFQPVFEVCQGLCSKHGKFDGKMMTVNGVAFQPKCPHCENEKQLVERIKNEDEKRRRDIFWQKSEIERKVKETIPPTFRNKNFDNFIAETKDQKDALKVCKKYAENFNKYLQKGTSLTFCGNVGTGKTHLACSVANHLIQQGLNPLFIGLLKAVRLVRMGTVVSPQAEQEAIEWFAQPDLLIIDEIGVQSESDYETRVLTEIFNYRYELGKPVIIISNLNVEGLGKYLGPRIVSRMKDRGGLYIAFTWEDQRGKLDD